MDTGVFRGLAEPQLSRLREDLALLKYSDPGAVRARLSTNGFALLADEGALLFDTGAEELLPLIDQLRSQGFLPRGLVLSHRHIAGARWRCADHSARIRCARVSASSRRQASTSHDRRHCVPRSHWPPADNRFWCRSRAPSWAHRGLDRPVPTSRRRDPARRRCGDGTLGCTNEERCRVLDSPACHDECQRRRASSSLAWIPPAVGICAPGTMGPAIWIARRTFRRSWRH